MISGKYGLRRVKYNPNNTKLTGEADRIRGTCPLTGVMCHEMVYYVIVFGMMMEDPE